MKFDEKTWVKVGFDGVSYHIAKKLIDKVIFCNIYEKIDLKKESLDTHPLHFRDAEDNILRYH